MKIIVSAYEKIFKKPAPYYCHYSLLTILLKPIIKYFNVVVIPNIPFNCIRIALYRMLGYKIGKNVFIGMKCYLDDFCRKLIVIEDNVIISYGVYFALHGVNQESNSLRIKSGAYIGMRSSIIVNDKHSAGMTIGSDSIIGANSLVNKSVPDNAVAVGVPIHFIEK